LRTGLILLIPAHAKGKVVREALQRICHLVVRVGCVIDIVHYDVSSVCVQSWHLWLDQSLVAHWHKLDEVDAKLAGQQFCRNDEAIGNAKNAIVYCSGLLYL
jgi:hypothetical protein